ncbi:hypothetical protein Q8A73_009322 [Channa argus]|nr:hypothetical protein Q8A73_009322 [Channa argus]
MSKQRKRRIRYGTRKGEEGKERKINIQETGRGVNRTEGKDKRRTEEREILPAAARQRGEMKSAAEEDRTKRTDVKEWTRQPSVSLLSGLQQKSKSGCSNRDSTHRNIYMALILQSGNFPALKQDKVGPKISASQPPRCCRAKHRAVNHRADPSPRLPRADPSQQLLFASFLLIVSSFQSAAICIIPLTLELQRRGGREQQLRLKASSWCKSAGAPLRLGKSLLTESPPSPTTTEKKNRFTLSDDKKTDLSAALQAAESPNPSVRATGGNQTSITDLKVDKKAGNWFERTRMMEDEQIQVIHNKKPAEESESTQTRRRQQLSSTPVLVEEGSEEEDLRFKRIPSTHAELSPSRIPPSPQLNPPLHQCQTQIQEKSTLLGVDSGDRQKHERTATDRDPHTLGSSQEQQKALLTLHITDRHWSCTRTLMKTGTDAGADIITDPAISQENDFTAEQNKHGGEPKQRVPTSSLRNAGGGKKLWMKTICPRGRRSPSARRSTNPHRYLPEGPVDQSGGRLESTGPMMAKAATCGGVSGYTEIPLPHHNGSPHAACTAFASHQSCNAILSRDAFTAHRSRHAVTRPHAVASLHSFTSPDVTGATDSSGVTATERPFGPHSGTTMSHKNTARQLRPESG